MKAMSPTAYRKERQRSTERKRKREIEELRARLRRGA
jgi:hypothetical protein